LRWRKDARPCIGDASGVKPADLLDMFVSDVLAMRGDTVRVFTERRMQCVGCVFAPFETVAEVARVYGIDPSQLASSLAAATGTLSQDTRQ